MSPKPDSKNKEECPLIISSDSSSDENINENSKKQSSNSIHDISAEIRTHCDREDGPISIPTDEESETDHAPRDTDDDLSDLSDNKNSNKKPARFSTPIKTKSEKSSSDSKKSFLAMPNEGGSSESSDDIDVPETLDNNVPETKIADAYETKLIKSVAKEVDSYENKLTNSVTKDIEKVLTNKVTLDETSNKGNDASNDIPRPVPHFVKKTDIDKTSTKSNEPSRSSLIQPSKILHEVSEEEKRQVALAELFNTDTESSMDTASQESASGKIQHPKSMMPPPNSVMVAPRAKTPPESPPVDVMISANGLLSQGKFHKFDVPEGVDLSEFILKVFNGNFPTTFNLQCAICKREMKSVAKILFMELVTLHRRCKLDSLRMIIISHDAIEIRHQFKLVTVTNSDVNNLPLPIRMNITDVETLCWKTLQANIFKPFHLNESSTDKTRKYLDCLKLDTGLNPHFRRKSFSYHCRICAKEELLESRSDKEIWEILRQHVQIELYFGMKIESLYNFGLPKNFATMSFDTIKSTILSSPRMRPVASSPIIIYRDPNNGKQYAQTQSVLAFCIPGQLTNVASSWIRKKLGIAYSSCIEISVLVKISKAAWPNMKLNDVLHYQILASKNSSGFNPLQPNYPQKSSLPAKLNLLRNQLFERTKLRKETSMGPKNLPKMLERPKKPALPKKLPHAKMTQELFNQGVQLESEPESDDAPESDPDVIYVPNTSRVPRRRKLKPLTRKRQEKSEREVERYIEEFEENQHKEYMKIKIELGEVASVKLEQSDLA